MLDVIALATRTDCGHASRVPSLYRSASASLNAPLCRENPYISIGRVFNHAPALCFCSRATARCVVSGSALIISTALLSCPHTCNSDELPYDCINNRSFYEYFLRISGIYLGYLRERTHLLPVACHWESVRHLQIIPIIHIVYASTTRPECEAFRHCCVIVTMETTALFTYLLLTTSISPLYIFSIVKTY